MLCFLVQLFIPVFAQNNLPGTYIFDEPPTAIFAQTIYNDTIVCIGNVFKEGDTINYQQGVFIAFIDSCGNLIHYKKFFDPQGRDIFSSLSNKIVHTSEGGYCFTSSLGLQNLLIKTDSEGNLVFMREYPLPNGFEYAYFSSIHEINNSFYVIGYGGTNMPVEDDFFLIKFDKDGDQIGYWRFSTPENCEYFQDAIVKGKNIVVSAGQLKSCPSNTTESKTRIFEVDTSANILWNWVDNNPSFKNGWGLGLKSTSDGGWVYAGAYSDTIIGPWDYHRLFVTKIDSNRNNEWTRIIGVSDYNEYNFFRDIAIDYQGNYLIAGQYTTGHSDFPDPNPTLAVIVTKITPLGEIQWTNIAKAYDNGPGNGMLMFTTNINMLSSGNIIVGGYLYRTLPIELQNEGWLAKLSPSGEVLDEPDPLCGFVSSYQPQAEGISDIRCYPNPTSGLLNIISSVGLPKGSTWRLFDIYGYTLHLENIENNIREMEIDISFLPTGIYFWEIRSKDEGLMKSGKILKQ